MRRALVLATASAALAISGGGAQARETQPNGCRATNGDVGCIVASQVVVDGRRVGWRAGEDAGLGASALSAAETVAVLDALMRIESPGPEVAAAVRGAVAWLREQAIYGHRLRPGQPPEVVPGVGPVWASFYEVGSNRPLFAADGLARHDWRALADSAWRRAWFTAAPAAVLAKVPAWAATVEPRAGRAPRAAVAAVVDARHGGADGALVGGVRTYRTIGAALAAAPAASARPHVISVRAGRYREKLSIEKPNIHLVGESRDATVLTYDAAAGQLSPGGWQYGTRGSFTLRIGAPGFRLERMTVENAFDFLANDRKPDSDSTRLRGSQAVAVFLDEGNDQAVFRDCRLSGHQDTLFPNAGRTYFHRCEISGSVDFIFGAGRAVFDDCDVVSRDRGSATNNGYVTAPSTPISQPYGFLFVRSRLKKETPSMAPNSVTLGRPWHPSGRPDAIGSAVFIDTWMDDHVGATGWSPMNSRDAAGHTVENRPEDARFFEHGSTGPGAVASPSRRVLTAEQARGYSIVRVLDGWDPRTP